MSWALVAALCATLMPSPGKPATDRTGLRLDLPLHGSLVDASGQGHNAIASGKPSGATIAPDCLRLDGSGAWLDTGTTLPEVTSTFSMEVCVKPSESQRPYADVLGNHENQFRGFAIQRDGTQNHLYYFTYGDGAAWFYTPRFKLEPNRWQLLAVVKTRDRVRVYLDGTLVSSTPAPHPMVPSHTPLLIGLGISGQERYFAGEVANVRIWDCPRAYHSTLPSSQQVALFARAGRVTCEPKAQWGLFRPGEPVSITFATEAEAVPLAISQIALSLTLENARGARRVLPTIVLQRQRSFRAGVRMPALSGYRKLVCRPTFTIGGRKTTLPPSTLHYYVYARAEARRAPGRRTTVAQTARSWIPSRVASLDGEWLIATDPANEGKTRRWYEQPRQGAVKTRVPWIIQDAFPGYHGVAWYWRDVHEKAGPAGCRYLLRFEAVDYLADVWLNGRYVGGHEGGETPFTLDVTGVLRPGSANRLAVRVLNPTSTPIDGMTLANTPHRAKCLPYTAGGSYDHGGIVGPVTLETVPQVWLEDLYAVPNLSTGNVRVRLALRNAGDSATDARVELTVAPAAGGEVAEAASIHRRVGPGVTVVDADLTVEHPRKWDLTDPFLYRVTARAVAGGLGQERSTRIGFRDFQLDRGYFRLNGRRIYLRSSHTVNAMPVGQQVPPDPGLFRRDLVLMKAMGFNMIRFIWGGATREQLDACDEIGLMALVEHSASNPFEVTPQMESRFDHSIGETVRLHRNHPSVVAWGLLNETPDGPYFRHAAGTLPLVRSLDATRVVLLNSGRWDGQKDIGSVCNPGATGWDGYLGGEGPGNPASHMSGPGGYTLQMGDVHAYPRVPHTADTIRWLATFGKEDHHVFLSEYGIGSAVDLWRITRKFEQIGKPNAEDAQFYRQKLDQFATDWERWKMADCFGDPQRYFAASLEKMAGQRVLGLNAIRANPNLLGHSVTGMMDHVNCGEGLFTLFRELKPGTVDAMAECWAPLRLCLFAEPVNAYRGGTVHLKAVLANEDALAPGSYPIQLTVYGPAMERLLERTVTVTVGSAGASESPFAIPFFDEAVPIDGPAGRYRFTATMLRGGAPTGGDVAFYMADPATLPRVERAVALLGDDPDLMQWLTARGARVRPFDPAVPAQPDEVILVTAGTPPSDLPAAWHALAAHVDAGATAIVLCPSALRHGDDSTGWLPLAHRGAVTAIPGWLYLKDEWVKRHAYFEGLPSGGMMDYAYYREVIPDEVLTGLDAPDEAIAGAIKASQDYSSGLMLATYRIGTGRLVLSTLRIRENLGRHPAADRLLVNLLDRR